MPSLIHPQVDIDSVFVEPAATPSHQRTARTAKKTVTPSVRSILPTPGRSTGGTGCSLTIILHHERAYFGSVNSLSSIFSPTAVLAYVSVSVMDAAPSLNWIV